MKLLRRTDLHTLTGAYALDAIDGTERERFENHLHRCPSCDHEVRGLQETATRLAVAVARVPPPDLKATVLTAAARTRQQPPVVEESPVALPRPARRPRLAITVAAVASVLVIALGVALGVQHGQLNQARAQQRQVAAALAQTRAQERLVTAALAQTRAQQRRAAVTLTALGARVATGRTSLGGQATVIVATRLDRMIVTTRGLPHLRGRRVYQLWLVTPAHTATSAGLLRRAARGRTRPVLVPRPPRGDGLAMTVEPAGGTTQPTTKPIVVIAVPA